MSKTKKEVVDVEPIDPFEGFNNITNQIIPVDIQGLTKAQGEPIIQIEAMSQNVGKATLYKGAS